MASIYMTARPGKHSRTKRGAQRGSPVGDKSRGANG
ncbi:TPA: hypothetical protein N0F65_008657 [Lagenidium giganteum]|uniref:Ribosomal protein L2 n=1 Tax=Lagenidium giganteum TaxID=4803 RepID=A0AAV2Z4Z5_9STRA|nr:TPA: hypothetical protein N0F65_008657 [Lagenidium giganteum]